MEGTAVGREGDLVDKNAQARVLICVDCKEEFAFTVAAQEYFAERGYTEAPKRCKTCHLSYKRHEFTPAPSESFKAPE